jgi:tetratricopeptide (TPR) repeat protein
MAPERLRQIEELYHRALDQDAHSRAAFVAEACLGDEALRQEVESLLAADDDADTFLETPAAHAVAKARAQEEARWNLAGKVVSHYQVIRQIGAGGMGVVYLARDETLDRQVALKVLPASRLADETARQRLRKEALALAKFSHPNIETVYEFGSQGGIDFLVTEYVAGTTLAARIESGPLPESELLDIALQVGSALEEAAGHGLIHLDLKPGNIMLMPKGQIKLLDFGLARIARADEDGVESLTTVNVPAGTPPYMAPEQLRGGSLDVRTDIYALGASLYELATGRVPFRGGNSPEVIAAILLTEAAPPSSLGASVSPGLEKVILKCLEKDPERRYQTVGELLLELAPPQGAQSKSVLPARGAARFRPRAKVWVRRSIFGVLVLSLAAAVLAVWLLRSRPVLSFARRDWVLVADFDNQTNDPLFDQSLLTAFSVSLEQSRYANLYPHSRVLETLARMKKDVKTKIDESVGREIAVRQGIRALILPSISGVGEDFRLAARIRDVASGTDVETIVVKAAGKNRILDSLDTLAAKVRRDLGESLLATSRSNRPLSAVTTASLDALKQYSIGIQKLSDANYGEARFYYENALKIDPVFTSARSSLGILDFEHFDRAEGKRLLSEAVLSTDNLTDREKYALLAFHARAVEGNFEKAIGYHRLLTSLYPDFARGHNNLAVVYRDMGRYPEAVAEFKECLRIDSHLRIAFAGLVYTYISLMGDLDAGIEACRTDIAKNGPSSLPYSWMGYAHLGKGRLDEGVSDLLKADDLDPKFIPSRYDLALAYLLSGDNENAIKILNEIVAIDPKACDAHYYMAIAFDAINQKSDARRHWLQSVDCQQETLKLRANSPSSYLAIALARTRLGDTAGARAADEKAHSIDPAFYFDTARLRSLQGRTEEALGLIERAEKNGYHDFTWAKLNPDLRSLSTQPRFQAVLHRTLKGGERAPLTEAK